MFTELSAAELHLAEERLSVRTIFPAIAFEH
jgi:hypothetical protein